MSNESKADKKAAKKERKAEKKANKQPKNPEVVKTVLSAITAVICVIAIVLTSTSITTKICKTNVSLAEKYPASSGDAKNAESDPFADDGTGTTDDGTGTVDPGTGTTDDGTGTVDPGTGTTDDGTANSGTANSGTANSGTANSGTANKGGSSAAAAANGAPVGKDIAKIVAYYNDAANKTKAYKGNMKIHCKDGTITSIKETSFPDVAIGIANKLLPNDYPGNEDVTVSNGHVTGKKVRKDGTTKDINKSINDYIVVYGDSKMSKLSASGVQQAVCKKVNGGYQVALKLKPEQVKGLKERPVNHNACMQVMDITEDQLDPFTLEECTVKYPGGTIIAVINDQGMLTSYHAVDPMEMSGTLKYGLIKGTATLSAKYEGEYTFTY